MFTIKSIHAEPFTDRSGNTAVRLTLLTKIAFMQKERVIPAIVFSDNVAVSKVVEIVNNRISPVVYNYRILWLSDIESLNEKIKSIDKSFFTEDRLGIFLLREVLALIRDFFNQNFLLDSTV